MEMSRGIEKYKSAWKHVADKGFADLNPFMECRYNERCRSYDCQMLVTSVAVKRCLECVKLWRPVFNASKIREDERTLSKFKGNAYCNSPEIKRRVA